MIKGIIIVTMMAVAAMSAEVEKLWSDAKMAFMEYRFSEAVELTEKYLANAKHDKNNDGKCAELVARAEKAAEMMESIEEITILDSVKTLKKTMLEQYVIPKETGMIRQIPTGGVMFTTGRGDRSIVAEKEGEQFDLYLTYSDGEKRKLPEIVNTAANEYYPFELTDGATLYFSSDGHGSIGGYDLYVTRYNNETQRYSEPMHIGMPFNSLYNDYMMVIDELSNVGWFATDRYQTGDTVVIYKFKVTDEKNLLPQELDEATKIATAQMKRYRVGYDEKAGKVSKGQKKAEIVTFRFVVNDTLIYTSESQFKDSLSVGKYHEIQELESAVNLQSIVLEGMKREYHTSDNEEDRAMLRKEILEDEEYINESRRKIGELTKEIRKLEYLRMVQ